MMRPVLMYTNANSIPTKEAKKNCWKLPWNNPNMNPDSSILNVSPYLIVRLTRSFLNISSSNTGAIMPTTRTRSNKEDLCMISAMLLISSAELSLKGCVRIVSIGSPIRVPARHRPAVTAMQRMKNENGMSFFSNFIAGTFLNVTRRKGNPVKYIVTMVNRNDARAGSSVAKSLNPGMNAKSKISTRMGRAARITTNPVYLQFIDSTLSVIGSYILLIPAVTRARTISVTDTKNAATAIILMGVLFMSVLRPIIIRTYNIEKTADTESVTHGNTLFFLKSILYPSGLLTYVSKMPYLLYL